MRAENSLAPAGAPKYIRQQWFRTIPEKARESL
jgi:hypothetical protein